MKKKQLYFIIAFWQKGSTNFMRLRKIKKYISNRIKVWRLKKNIYKSINTITTLLATMPKQEADNYIIQIKDLVDDMRKRLNECDI